MTTPCRAPFHYQFYIEIGSAIELLCYTAAAAAPLCPRVCAPLLLMSLKAETHRPPSATFTTAGYRFRQGEIPPSVEAPPPPLSQMAAAGFAVWPLLPPSEVAEVVAEVAGSGEVWGGWQRSLETPLMQDESGRLKKLKKESCSGIPVNVDVASSDFLVLLFLE